MRVAIAGGHGKIALLIERMLSETGHEAVGIIRNPEQAPDLLLVGGIPLVIDLETASVETVAQDLDGIDAVVFAAGAGPGSGADRKLTIDRDGAILLADAAERRGIGRYVLISARAADSFDAESDDVFQVYLRAKAEADENIRGRNLDWTIIRPGSLTDDPPTGLIQLAEDTGPGSISRADVAAVVVQTVLNAHCIRHQFELISGTTEISDALSGYGAVAE
jgi:uncharacterized protein YbjT (DUF2867 family)